MTPSAQSDADLTVAQRRMLERAAAGRGGECWVRRGQHRTAQLLEYRGLGGTYKPDAYSTKFAISDKGRTCLES